MMGRNNVDEKRDILNAKYNEVQTKAYDLDRLRKVEYERDKELKKWYAFDEKTEGSDLLINWLCSSTNPKYVRLGRVLTQLESIRENQNNVLRAQANIVIMKNPIHMDDKTVKTTYKEFEQIEKRAVKANSIILKSLKKYQDVVEFYNSPDFINLCLEAKKLNSQHEVLNPYFDEHKNIIMEFLDSSPYLQLLYQNDNSKHL